MPSFHNETNENAELNQYWYSQKTCETLCNAVRESMSLKGASSRIAFLSTPSLFFSLSEEEQKQCTLFDFDNTWESCSQFEFYDYNNPNKIDAKLHGKFDVSSSRFLSCCCLTLHNSSSNLSSYPKVIVIDPPFISQSVWESYATTTALLGAKEGAHIIATTVEQNEVLMKSIFSCKRCIFQPSIPSLVYQYNCYSNLPSATLATNNSELE